MICLACGKTIRAVGDKHLKKCSGISVGEYRDKFPNTPLMDDDVRAKLGQYDDRGNFKAMLRNRNRVDFTGRKNGLLTAIRFLRMEEHPTNHGRAIWLFKCDCGNELERVATRVFSSQVNKRSRKSVPSCGCRISAKKLPPNTSGFRAAMRRYILNSATRGIEFLLSDDECKALFDGDCYYCGAKPANIPQTGPYSRSKEYRYNGIDRVNNDLDYVAGNVVSCCWTCNKMKLAMTQYEFYAHITRIHNLHVFREVSDE